MTRRAQQVSFAFDAQDREQSRAFLASLHDSLSCVSLHFALSRFHLIRPVDLPAAGAVQLLHALASVCGAQLRELHLSRCFVPLRDENPLDVADALVALLAAAPSIDSLRFSNHGFLVGSVFGRRLLGAVVAHVPSLSHLDLCENYVRFDGVAVALDWLRANSTLRRLDLSDCLIDADAHLVIGAVARHPALEAFRFAHLAEIDATTTAAIVDFVQNSPRTTEFDLSDCRFLDAADFVAVVDAVRACTRLRALGISFGAPAKYISGASVDALVSLIECNSTLRSLQLRGRVFELASERDRFVAALVRNTTLLDVSKSRFETLPLDVLARNRCNLLRDVALVLLAAPLPPYVVGEIVQYCDEFAAIAHAATMRTICGAHRALTARRPRAQ
jgi:hypothetical protein